MDLLNRLLRYNDDIEELTVTYLIGMVKLNCVLGIPARIFHLKIAECDLIQNSQQAYNSCVFPLPFGILVLNHIHCGWNIANSMWELRYSPRFVSTLPTAYGRFCTLFSILQGWLMVVLYCILHIKSRFACIDAHERNQICRDSVVMPSTHWGRATHTCVSKLTIIASDNGLSPGWRQAIIWNNAGIFSKQTSVKF